MELANSDLGQETSNATGAYGCKKPVKPLVGAIFTGGIANIGYKKKKAAYDECVAKGQADEAASNTLSKSRAEASATPAPATPTTDKAPATDKAPSSASSEDKLLGMPKKVAYVVIALGVVAVAFGGWKAYKHFKK